MAELKELSGLSGRGMKRLERLRAVLKCVDVEEVDGQNLGKLAASLTTLRQKGRLQIACRSAASILESGQVESLPTLSAEIKNLHISLPKKLKARLDQLEASQGQGGRASQ
eukprot:9117217-Alexandrium_andersonii.AAC.1